MCCWGNSNAQDVSKKEQPRWATDIMVFNGSGSFDVILDFIVV